MPVHATETSVQMSGPGINGKITPGKGWSGRLSPEDVRSFATVYSQEQCNAAFVSLTGAYNNPAWITAIDVAKVTGLNATLAAKADLIGGLVPSHQLPSYVDDVIEAADFASLPGTGESGKIYVTLATGKTYRWSGSAYVELTDATAVWGQISGSLLNQTDLISHLSTNYSPLGHSHSFASLTGKPNSIAGYGITDAGTIIGSTGTANNKLLFSSGTGGSTVKASVITSPNNYVCSPEIDEGLSGPRLILNKGVPTSQICGLEVSSNQQLMLWGNWVQLYNSRLLPLYYSSQNLEIGASDGAMFMAGAANAGARNWSFAAGGLHVANNYFSQSSPSKLRVYSTIASTTSFEAIEIKANTGANFEFGPMRGSAGGTLRGLTIGGYATESASITPWLTFANTGEARFAGNVFLHASANTGFVPQGNTRFLAQCNGAAVLYFDSTIGVFSGNGGEGWAGNLNACSRTVPTLNPRTNSPTTGVGGDPANGILSLIVGGAEILSLTGTATTLVGDLKFPDATHDIGKSGATRPRDGFFSRNVTVGNIANINEINLGGAAQGYITLGVGTSALSVMGSMGAWGSISFGAGWGAVSASNGGGVVISVTDSTGTVHQRNGSTAQTYRLYETYTSGTSFGALQLKANTSAAYQLGSAVGSAGGTNRDIHLGNWDAAGLFATAVQIVAGGQLNVVNSSSQAISINAANQVANNPLISTNASRLKIHAAGDGLHISSAAVTFNNTLDASLAHRGRIVAGAGSFSLLSTAGVPFVISDYSDGNGNVVAATVTVAGGNASQVQAGTNPQGADLVLRGGHGCPLATVTSAFGGNVVISGGNGYGTGRTGSVFVSQAVCTAGTPSLFTVTGAAHTTLATAEVTDGYFNAARTVNFGATGGTIASQRTWRFTAPTFTAAAATTLTKAATVSISGAPVAGTGVTASEVYAFDVESGSSRFGGTVRVASGELYIHQQIFAQDAVINFNGSKIRSGPGWGAMSDLSISFENSSSLQLFRVDTSGYIQCSNNSYLMFSSNGNTGDVSVYRDAPNILAQRRGTNAQAFRVYSTFTSSTSFEALQSYAAPGASFEIGPMQGSSGGTLRGLILGGYTNGGASGITPWLSFSNAGDATFSGTVNGSGNVLDVRSGSTAQKVRIFATRSAVDNYEALALAPTTSGVTVGLEVGAAGGLTTRNINFGHWDAAGTFKHRLAMSSSLYAFYSDTSLTMRLFAHGANATGPRIEGYKARGTDRDNKNYPLNNDTIFGIYGYGHDEALATWSGAKAQYTVSAANDWTATSQGTQHSWTTTDTDDTGMVNTTRMRLFSNGNLALGTTVQTAGLFQLVKNNGGATGFGTALNRLRFTDADTATAAGQPIGEIEFYSADSGAPGASVKGSFVCAAASATPDAYFAWGLDKVTGAVSEVMRLTSDAFLGVGVAPTAPLDVAGNGVRIRTSRTPASITAAGNAGDICWDNGFVYVCVATNSWKRATLATW